jgi:hypothetical protein
MNLYFIGLKKLCIDSHKITSENTFDVFYVQEYDCYFFYANNICISRLPNSIETRIIVNFKDYKITENYNFLFKNIKIFDVDPKSFLTIDLPNNNFYINNRKIINSNFLYCESITSFDTSLIKDTISNKESIIDINVYNCNDYVIDSTVSSLFHVKDCQILCLETNNEYTHIMDTLTSSKVFIRN